MPEIKNTFLKSKMNKDLDSRIIGNGEYRDAQNASVSASEDASVGSLENIRGNQLLSFFNISDVNIEIIGQYSDNANNRMFFFLTNYSDSSIDTLSNSTLPTASTPPPTQLVPGSGEYYSFDRAASAHYICYCQLPNVRSSSEINLSNIQSSILVSGNFLNFSKTHPIEGINIIENLLFWTDNRNQPRKINIDTAINSSWVSTAEPGYYYNEDHVSVAKYAPYSPISFAKNFITGAYQSTLLNEKDEWLPPFFAAPGNVNSSTTPNRLQFNSSQGSAASQAVSSVSTFLGNTATSPWVNNNIRVQPANDSAAEFAFISSISTVNNYLILQDSSSSIINNIASLGGWPKTLAGVAFPEVFNFSMKNPNYNPSFSGDKEFLEDKFPRFSYRFKYDDNEYSLTAPFSQHAFVPKQFGYFLTGDADKTKDSSIVKFMENQITTAELVFDLPYAPNEMFDKLKVKELQLLYKSSDDQNVKIIQEIDLQNSNLQLGCPKTYSVVDGGSSQTNGYYKQIPLTGGTGTGALMDGRVMGGALMNLSLSTLGQTSPIPNTGSLLKGAIPASNWTSTATSATVDTTATIGPTSSAGGFYSPNSGLASFEITTDSTGAVSSVTVLNGGGGYTSGDVLLLTLGTAFGGTPVGVGIITLTISQSMIAGDINGEGYKVGDILTFASLGGVGTGGTVKVDSLTNTFLYKYNSEKPIKVLTDKEVTRVSDIIPMRAKTQEAVGNRIIYGNFLQNKSTPVINYSLDIQAKGAGTSFTDVEYNNNTLKQGRSYQVGIVLLDRYGRSSNVIINNNSSLNSTIFSNYTNAGTDPLSWLGNSLRITFEDSISSTFSPEENGFYSETNPLGWYTYKVVVQQQEQEYYNVYTAGGLSGNIVYTKNDADITIGSDAATQVKIDGLRYSNENEAFQIALFNDNINKIPRELKEVGDTDAIFSSNIHLYNRVKNNNLNTDSGAENDQNLSNQNELDNTLKQEVNTVKSFKELGQWTSYKNVDLHYLNINPADGTSQFGPDTFIYPGAKGNVDPFYLKNNQNPFIATISTSSRMGFTSDIQESFVIGTGGSASEEESRFSKSLMVFETKPFKSNLEIYYETSTSDLISKLNKDISEDIDPSGDTVLNGIDDVSVTSWLESTLPGAFITNEFTALNSNGDPLSGAASQILQISILNVVSSVAGSSPITNIFDIEETTASIAPSTPPAFRIKLKSSFDGIPYSGTSNVINSYFVTLEASSGNQSIQKVVTLKLGNVEPKIYRFQGIGNQLFNSNTSAYDVPVQALLPGDDILNDFLRANMTGAGGYQALNTAGFASRASTSASNEPFYTQVMNCAALANPDPFSLLNGGNTAAYPLGYNIGYVSHFSNGFRTLDNIPIAPDYLPSDFQNITLKQNDAFFEDQNSSSSAFLEPKTMVDVNAVVVQAIRYNGYYNDNESYGTPPPRNFTTFVPRGWYTGINDPLAQLNSGSDLNPRDVTEDFRFETTTINRFITKDAASPASLVPSKKIQMLIYRPFRNSYDSWHDRYNRNWLPCWYHQIKIVLKDASSGTGSLTSLPYYINFLVLNNS